MKIHCVVTNAARHASRFWGEHGVAFLVEAPGGLVLFDTGQSGTVFRHNAELLGLNLDAVDALALSHAHYDHTGGLAQVLPLLRPGLPCYANPDIFRARYTLGTDGEAEFIGFPLPVAELTARVEMRFHAAPTAIVPGVWTTGVIEGRPFFEGRSPRHVIRQGDAFVPDPYADDLALVLETDQGLVVLCGCCHAGLLNTLAHVRRHFAGEVIAVIGGTHLARVSDADLRQAAATLRDTYGSPLLYLNHCSGERAFVALAQAFGERVQPCDAGTTLIF